MVFEILITLSVGALGIFLGAQITEGVLFVPYWKDLPPKDFFEFYKRYGKKIHQFFAPLTILATFLPLLSLVYGFFMNIPDKISLVITVVFAVLFFSTYYLYFKHTNKKFAEASIPDNELAAELTRWGNWHWGRTACELIAFTSAMATLINL